MLTLQDLYTKAYTLGKKYDPRSKEHIERYLKQQKDLYEKLPDDEKEYFDTERFINPYADSRILYGDPKTPVKKMMVGIDVDTSELSLVYLLNQQGAGFDLVMSHHPAGIALKNLHSVMGVQVDVLARYNVPVNITEKLMSTRTSEVMRSISPLNVYKTVHAAEHLNLPFMSIHTATDNLAYTFLKDYVDERDNNIFDMNDLRKVLLEIPEFSKAEKMSIGPELFLGSKTSRTGKIAVTEFTGGTSGPKELYEKLAYAGVGTIVSMHTSDINRKEAQKHNLNILIAGHMASDSLGINLLMDEYEKSGVQVEAFSGFIRHSRNKKSKNK